MFKRLLVFTYIFFFWFFLLKAQDIQHLEYFFNTDPGFGKATPIELSAKPSFTSSFNIPLAGLETGMHELFIRAKDSNDNWSLTNSQVFFIDPILTSDNDIQYLEYFIDTDPGFGNGTQINIENKDVIALNLNLNFSKLNLDYGFHKLFVRSKDNKGRWSHTAERVFYLQAGTSNLSKINKLEYFLSSEDYTSPLQEFKIPEPSTSIDLNFQADLSFLPDDSKQYEISIYAINEHGIRSLVETKIINVCNGAPVKASFDYSISDGVIILNNTSKSGDSSQWIIGEEVIEKENHSFEYKNPGRYPVSLVASNICNQDTISQIIEVPGITSVFPLTGSIKQTEATLTISGFGLDSLPQIQVVGEGGVVLQPFSLVRADSANLRATFNFSQIPIGDYKIQVINDSDGNTYTLEKPFNLLKSGSIPYDQWVDFELAPDSTLRRTVLVPQSDNLLITMKKADRIGYSSTWKGELSLLLNNKLIDKASGSSDLEIEFLKPESNLYTIEIPNRTNKTISGKVKASFAPDWLPLNLWSKGEVLRPYGYDWKYVEVGPNVDTLFFETEGYGLWSTIEVFQESLTTPVDYWNFSNMGAGYAIKGHILSPDPGRYYLRYKDSAVLRKTKNNSQLREYLVYAGVDKAVSIGINNRTIEKLSAYEIGSGDNTITLTGRGFSNQDSLVLINKQDSTYHGMHAIFKSSNEMLGNLDFSQIPNGEYFIGIYGVPIQFHDEPILIQQELKQEVKVELIARDQFRIGRYQKFIVRLTNEGNVDKNFISLFVSGIPVNAKIRFDSEISTIDESVYPFDSLSHYEIIDEEIVLPLFVNSLPVGESLDVEISIYLPEMQDFELQVAVDELFDEKINALSNNELGNYIQLIYELDSLFDAIEELETQTSSSRRNDLISDATKSSYSLIFEKINKLANTPISNECSQELGKSFGNLLAIYTKKNRDRIIGQIKDGVLDFMFGGWKDCISKSASTIKNNIWDPISKNRGSGAWNTTKKVFLQHDLYSNVFHSGLNCANALLTTPISPSGLALKLSSKAMGKVSTQALYRMTVRRKQLNKNMEKYLFDISIAKSAMDTHSQISEELFDPIKKGFNPELGIGFGCQQEVDKVLKFIQGISSVTPEDKYGPSGFDQNMDGDLSNRKRFIPQDQIFEYKIDYWNKENATAPASEVFIRDTLDMNFDISTVNFTEIGFLGWKVPIQGGQYFNVTIDLRPEKKMMVNVEGTVNLETREIYWVHRSLDPQTMELPEDPTAGYLPPIDSTGYNIGWVIFTVEAVDSLGHNTTFKNQAHVNFDGVGPWGPAPPYGPFTNTFDLQAPKSSIEALPEQSNPEFTVRWVGTDEGGGVSTYNIFVQKDKGDFDLWKNNTSLQESTFSGETGHNYSFYSVATDFTGNEETKTDTIEASTYIPEIPGVPQLLSPNKFVISADKFTWTQVEEGEIYTVQVSTDSVFENILLEEFTADTSWTTGEIEEGVPYYWRVMASNVSGHGAWSEVSNFKVDLVSGIQSTGNDSKHYHFGKIKPNPTKQDVTFEFSIPERNEVRIDLFNLSGQYQKTLVDQALDRGSYKVNSSLINEPSGVYLIRLSSGNFVETHRLILNK